MEAAAAEETNGEDAAGAATAATAAAGAGASKTAATAALLSVNFFADVNLPQLSL